MKFKDLLAKWGYVALGVLAAAALIVAAQSRKSFGDALRDGSQELVRTLGLRSLSGVYQADLKVVADFDANPLMAAASRGSRQEVSTQGLTSRLRSDMVFVPTAEGVDLTFTNVVLEIGGILEHTLSAELEKIHVRLKGSSTVGLTDIGVNEGVRTQTVAILSQLLAQLQMTPTMTKNTLDTTEEDVFGRYQAHYEWDGSRAMLTRTKLKYLSLDQRTFGGASDSHIAPGQTWQATFDSGRLRSIHGRETLTLRKNGSQLLKQVVHFELERIEGRNATLSSSPHGVTWLSYRPGFLSEYRDPKMIDQIYRQELGSVTEFEILSALPSIKNQDDEVHWYRKVRAYIHLHPERSEAFAPLLQEASLESVTMRVVAPALGRIGHKEAQRMLQRVITARLEKGKATATLFPLLVQSPTPTPESIQFVRGMVHSDQALIRTSALLAYGRLAGSTRHAAPETSAEIVTELRHLMNGESHPDMLRTLIFAAANSQSPEFTADLAAIADHTPDPSLKGHAVEAMGFLGGAQALSKLQTYLKGSEIALQKHALIALAQMPYDQEIGNEVVSLARIHASSPVRRAAMDWVFQHRDRVESAHVLFQELRDHDPNLDIRKRAASILSIQ
jgi:hypothetical protein